MATMTSVNPASGEVLGRFDEISDAELEARLARAAQTFRTWRRRPFAERARLVSAAGDVLERCKDHWARIMTLEMGKTLKSAVAEAEKCAWVCRFYAEHGERFLADEDVKASATRSYVRCLPLGPVLAVMPWNFPFWQVFRFAAPALAAGNVGLLKHASNVPQCALAIEEVFREAGLPEPVLVDGEGVEQERVQVEPLAVEMVHLFQARVLGGVADQVHEAVVHRLDLLQALEARRVLLALLEEGENHVAPA